MKIILHVECLNERNYQEINDRIRDFKKSLQFKYNIIGQHYLEIL